MTERAISADHEKSLIAAGIAKRYHQKDFVDFPKGDAMQELMSDYLGNDLKYNKRSLLLKNAGLDIPRILGLKLHLSGYGVRIMSLVALDKAMRNRGNERWEEIMDAKCLIITPAQNERECPLEPHAMEFMESFFLDRIGAEVSVVLCFSQIQPAKAYFSRDFMTSFMTQSSEITL